MTAHFISEQVLKKYHFIFNWILASFSFALLTSGLSKYSTFVLQKEEKKKYELGLSLPLITVD